MKKISFLLFFNLLLSCNNRPDLSTLKLVLDEKIEIPFNGEIYQAMPVIYDFNTNGDLIIYDHSTDELQLLNVPEKSIIKKIKIERDGPNAISSSISSVFLYSDRYYVIASDAIYVLDSNGIIEKEVSYISILDKLDLNPNKKINPIRGGWDKTSSNIYFNYTIRNNHEDQFQSMSKFIEFVRFDPISESGELFRIPTPDGLIKNDQGHYFSLIPKLSIANNKIVYMWSVFPEVYVYDLKTKNILEITCIPEDFSKIPPFPYRNYTKTSPYYYRKGGTTFTNISYDPENEKIYRIHLNYLNNQIKGDQNLSVISMLGECLNPIIPENSGWAMGTYNGELHIIQRDIPDENALRINRYALVSR